MNKHLYGGLGVVLLCVLVVVLEVMLPPRASPLRGSSSDLIPANVTWTELADPSPKAKRSPARSPDSASADRSRAIAQTNSTAFPTENERRSGAYTIDFGPFVTGGEADETEARLNELGVPASRYRQRSSSSLYTVMVGEFTSLAQAIETVKELRLRHPKLPAANLETTAGGAFTIVVDTLSPLREAVTLAEQLRKERLVVRIKTAPGSAPVFGVRLEETYDLQAAQELSQQYRDQGLPNAVIPAEPSASH